MKNKHSIILLAISVVAAFMAVFTPVETNAQNTKRNFKKDSTKIKKTSRKIDPCKNLPKDGFTMISKDNDTSSADANESEESKKTSDGKSSRGVLNGKASNLVRPGYPPAAKAVRANGAVDVQVLIDEKGKVVSASAVSGHPLLRQAAEEAARASVFGPVTLSGCPVKVSGIIVYNFVAQ